VIDVLDMAVSHIVYDRAPRLGPSPPQWPMPITVINWFHTRFFVREIYNTIITLEKRGYDLKEIAHFLWGPSVISHWAYFAQCPIKGLSYEEVIDFFEKTADLLACLRIDDIFCKSYKNILWNEENIRHTLNEYEYISVRENETLRDMFVRLNVMLWHYCGLINVGHHVFSHEFHGPYNLSDGKVLLVREYYNLKPEDVWNFTKEVPYRSLMTLEIYKDLQIKIDAFNHLETTEPLPSHLESFTVVVNNREFDGKDPESFMKVLFDKMGRALNQGILLIRNFDKKDWINKVIWMRHLYLKPAKDALGVDWRPKEELLSLPDLIGEAEKYVLEYIVKQQYPVVMKNPPDIAKEKLLILWCNNILSLKEGSYEGNA